MTERLKTILKYVKWIFLLSFIPLILIFVLSIHIGEIRKSKFEFHLSQGKIDLVGDTIRIHRGKSMRSLPFPTKTKVFFIKLSNNDTLYSYFSKDEMEYKKLFSNLNKNDFVKIYNKGFENTQNTVSIIQLEKNKSILIDKEKFNRKNYGLIIFISLILFLYFALPIFFIIKFKQEEKRIHKNQKHSRQNR